MTDNHYGRWKSAYKEMEWWERYIPRMKKALDEALELFSEGRKNAGDKESPAYEINEVWLERDFMSSVACLIEFRAEACEAFVERWTPRIKGKKS